MRRTERSMEGRGWTAPGTRPIQPRVGGVTASHPRAARRRVRALRISALWPAPHGRWCDRHSRGTRRLRGQRMRAVSTHHDGSGCLRSETREPWNRRRRTPCTRWLHSERPRAGSPADRPALVATSPVHHTATSPVRATGVPRAVGRRSSGGRLPAASRYLRSTAMSVSVFRA